MESLELTIRAREKTNIDWRFSDFQILFLLCRVSPLMLENASINWFFDFFLIHNANPFVGDLKSSH